MTSSKSSCNTCNAGNSGNIGNSGKSGKSSNFTLAIDACKGTLWVGLSYLVAGLLSTVPQILARTGGSGSELDLAERVLYAQQSLLAETPIGFGLMSILFSTIAVGLAFGFLFKRNSAEFYGSLPVSRTSLFASRYAAALLPLLAADLIMFAVMAIVGLPLGFSMSVLLNWLVIAAVLNFLCASVASLCAQLAGNIWFFILLALMATGYAWVLEFGVRGALDIFTLGPVFLDRVAGVFTWLSPMMLLVVNGVVNIIDGALVCAINEYMIPFAVAAVVLAVASALLFGKRRMEAAGDGLAFPKTRPFFSFVFSFAAGLGFALLVLTLLGVSSEGAGYGNPAAEVVFVVTFLAASLASFAIIEVALAKSAAVLRKRVAGFAAMGAVVAVLGCGIAFDIPNFTGNLPSVDEVQSVNVGTDCPDESDEGYIEQAIAANQIILEKLQNGEMERTSNDVELSDAVDGDWYFAQYRFNYLLKDGTTREYAYDVMFLSSDGNGETSVSKQMAALMDDLANAPAVMKDFAEDMEDALEAYGDKDSAIYLYDVNDSGNALSLPHDEALRFYREALKDDIKDCGVMVTNRSDYDQRNYPISMDFTLDEEFFAGSDDGGYLSYRMFEGALSKEHAPRSWKWLETHYGSEFAKIAGEGR